MNHTYEIITLSTNKTVTVIDIFGNTVVQTNTNTPFELPNDQSYIFHISNSLPVTNISFVMEFLNTTFGQLLSIALLLIIIGTLITFFRIIKKGGFK